MRSSGQITYLSNATSPPVPGSGHNYVGMLNETVNPGSGGLNMQVDVSVPKGREMTLPFGFGYDSSGVHFATQMGWDTERNIVSAGGWSYSLPFVTYGDFEYLIQPFDGVWVVCGFQAGHMLRDSSGTRHALNVFKNLGVGPYCVEGFSSPGTEDFYRTSLDSSLLRVADAHGTVYSFSGPWYGLPSRLHTGTSGGIALPSAIEDSNGNRITIQGNQGAFAITDTLGVPVLSTSGFGSEGDTVGVRGLSTPYTLHWGTASSNYDAGVSLVLRSGYESGVCGFSGRVQYSTPVVTAIDLPNGKQYRFQYDSTYGLISRIDYPTGGYISYVWGLNPAAERQGFDDHDTSGNQWSCLYQFSTPAVISRSVSFDGTNVALQQDFSYSTNWGALDWISKQTTVTTHDFAGGVSSTTEYNYQPMSVEAPASVPAQPSIVPVEQTIRYKDGAGNVLRTVAKTWQDQYLMTSEQVTLDNGLTAKTSYAYGPGAQVIEEDEYDSGAGAPGALLRRTVTNYASFPATLIYPAGPSIFDRPQSQIVYDGNNNRVKETDYGYDERVTLDSGVSAGRDPNYSTGYNTRGNETTVSQWVNTSGNFVSESYTYFNTGMLQQHLDANNHPITYAYDAAFAGAYVTQATNALGHSMQMGYDFNSGLLTGVRGPNDIQAGRSGTTYAYSDPLRRLTSVNYPDGGQTSFDYHADALPFTVTKTVLASPDPSIVSDTRYDGMGHAHQTELHDPEGDVFVDTTYDGFGRVHTVTNPHRAISAATDGTTQYTYDALGRVTDITKPDGNVIHTAYSGTATTVTDETGRQRRNYTDALERLIRVDEPGGAYAGSASSGSLAINGSLLSTVVGAQAATQATGSATLLGEDQVFTDDSACEWVSGRPRCPPPIWDRGSVSISVAGYGESVSYNRFSNTTNIASALASAFQNDPASPVWASSSGAVVSFTARAAGSGPNSWGIACSSVTNLPGVFDGPSFWSDPCGPSMNGGQDAYGGTTIYDSGTVTASVGGFMAAVPYGPGSNSTAAQVASALATALNAAGSPVTASASAAIIAITYKSAGSGGNIQVTAASGTNQPGYFPNGSFSGSTTLSGGTNPAPASLTFPYVTLYGYDTLGNLTSVNQQGDGSAPRNRSFTYDSLSRLLSSTNPESGPVSYTYDAGGNLLSKADARGLTVSYGYDPLNRLKTKTYSDGSPASEYFYDVTPPLQYNAPDHGSSIGRLTHASNGVNFAHDPTYDAMGRIISQAYCIPSDCSYNTRVAATYDLAGNLTSLTYPSGRKITHSSNAAGRLTGVSYDSFNGTPANYPYFSVPQGSSPANWGYAPGGELQLGNFGNGVHQTLGYNARVQVNAITVANSSILLNKTYNYSDPARGNGNNGNVINIYDGVSVGRNQSFGYDELNRVTSGVQNDGAFNQSFSYDPWGNLKQSGTWSFQPNYEATNRMTGYSYDAAGNLLNDGVGHAFTYDAEGRIGTVNGTGTTYTYGPDDERIRKEAGSSYTEYLYFSGSIVAEKDQAGWTDYIFADGQRIARADLGASIGVRFTNDSCSACGGSPVGGGDRNLYVNSVTLGSTTIQPNDSSVSYTAAPCNSYANGVGSLLCNGDMLASTRASAPSITVTAYGSPDYNVYPHMQVWVNGALVGEWDVTGTAQAYTAAISNNDVHYYHSDHLGTALLETDANGSVTSNCTYAPFGEETSCSPGDPFNHYRFTGKERDTETGDDYFGKRYYGSRMGRFLSPDPGPFIFHDPQSYNAYSYGLNNPLRYGDEEGLTPEDRVNAAKKLVGIPYVSGGGHGTKDESKGLDCSGLVYKVFKADPDNKLAISGRAIDEAAQLKSGGEFSSDIADARPGDAIFWTVGGVVHHVGIVVDVRDGVVYFIHAPKPGDHVHQERVKLTNPNLGNEKFYGVGRPIEKTAAKPASSPPPPGLLSRGWNLVSSYVSSWFAPSNPPKRPNPEPNVRKTKQKKRPCVRRKDMPSSCT
jgi:RHS repeat-associated protein